MKICKIEKKFLDDNYHFKKYLIIVPLTLIDFKKPLVYSQSHSIHLTFQQQSNISKFSVLKSQQNF